MPSYSQYKRQLAVLDADDSEIESWITVRGNHIPIMKGQSKEEAVKSFIESKSKGDGGKHYITTKQHGDTRYVNPKNYEIVKTKSEVTPFGSKAEAQSFAHKLNHTDPYAGTPFAVKNYERKQFPYEVESEENVKNGGGKSAEPKKEYNPDYETLKKELAAVGGERNLGLLGAAEKQRRGLIPQENAAEKEPAKPKNTYLSNPNTLKEFANYFGITESVAKKASEKFGDSFYHVMIKDPKAGAGLAMNADDYEQADVDKWLENNKTKKTQAKRSKPDNMVYQDKKHPHVFYVDPKAWNSPANDPWYGLYN